MSPRFRLQMYLLLAACLLASWRPVTAQQAPGNWQPMQSWPPAAELPLQPIGPPPTEQLPPAEMQLLPAEMQAIEEEPVTDDSYWSWSYDWIRAVDWDGGVELGLNATDGNSESLSLRSGFNLKRKTEINEVKTDLTYLKTTARGAETQHSALFNAGYERFLGESVWTYFLKSGLEYDEFKAFDLRLVYNGGLGYFWIRTDILKLKSRVGAGVSHEVNGPDDAWEPEAVFGGDYECNLTDRQKLAITADYFPQWSSFEDYRLVTDLGWEVLLDENANLSLKFSVKDRYDSTPNGRRPNDIDYALLLLWKI